MPLTALYSNGLARHPFCHGKYNQLLANLIANKTNALEKGEYQSDGAQSALGSYLKYSMFRADREAPI